MTLKECIDKYGFGVKFCTTNEAIGYWFMPLRFNLGAGYAIGESSSSICYCWGLDSEGWDICEKPKKKLKLCTYVHYFMDTLGSGDEDIFSTISVYSVPIAALEQLEFDDKRKKKLKYLTTVKFAETEVEVDDE